MKDWWALLTAHQLVDLSRFLQEMLHARPRSVSPPRRLSRDEVLSLRPYPPSLIVMMAPRMKVGEREVTVEFLGEAVMTDEEVPLIHSELLPEVLRACGRRGLSKEALQAIRKYHFAAHDEPTLLGIGRQSPMLFRLPQRKLGLQFAREVLEDPAGHPWELVQAANETATRDAVENRPSVSSTARDNYWFKYEHE